MTYFILGIILGVLVRDIKLGAEDKLEKLVDKIVEARLGDETKFIEPVDVKDEFNKSQHIDEFLNKLK